MAKQNTSEYALLGLLSQAPASGYDLRRESEAQLGHFWSESYASIYPMLKRLHTKGWVSRSHVEQNDKPDKQIYTITDDGLKAFQKWIDEPIMPLPPRNLTLLKLHFGSATSRRSLRKHIEDYRDRLMETLAQIEPEISRYRNTSSDSDSVFTLLTLSHTIHSAKASLTWCKSVLEVLNNKADGNRKD